MTLIELALVLAALLLIAAVIVLYLAYRALRFGIICWRNRASRSDEMAAPHGDVPLVPTVS